MNLLNEIFSVRNEYHDNKKIKILRLLGKKIKLNKNDSVKLKTVNYIIQMLKEYGIRNIISSAGCQNSMFNLLVQQDTYFNCYSVTDERSAGYMAIGIAEEIMEPVVITCTGATASRNWVPALTEAYYKNIPVIAIPFYNRAGNDFNLAAQYVDRKITQNDIKEIQIKLPEIFDDISQKQVLTSLNTAFSTAKYNNKPVIIEAPSNLGFKNLNDFKNVPKDVWHTECIDNITNESDELLNKNAAVFIGSHKKFTQEEESVLSDFVKTMNIPVFCDHTSNYHGENKIISARSLICGIEVPDLIIDIGGITGDYLSALLFQKAIVWRVSPDRSFNFRYDKPVVKTFMMSEKQFFKMMKNSLPTKKNYYDSIKRIVETTTFPDLPLSNYLIIENLSKYMPENSIIHHGVSNTKRGMNFYEFSESAEISCNVGACGIDGAVSTLVGHSFASPDKKCFGIMGDLTFFYDMSTIQNRDIKNNLRILLVNNNKGIEFKINGLFTNVLDETEKLIGSAGHKTTADGWAQSCGFHYMSAKTKESFLSQINDFCNKNYDKPVLFEVFTTDEDEIKAFKMMTGLNKNEKNR